MKTHTRTNLIFAIAAIVAIGAAIIFSPGHEHGSAGHEHEPTVQQQAAPSSTIHDNIDSK